MFDYLLFINSFGIDFQMPIKTILFDLDGTLINSSKGILKSLEYAFKKSSIPFKHPISSNIIGPPLPEMVKNFAGNAPPLIIDGIIADFAEHYDRVGCFEEIIYPNIDHLLRQLRRIQAILHVTTNKRHRPTQNILSHLNLVDFFTSVYSPDTLQPVASNKTQLLAVQLRNEKLCHDQCIYIGDRQEDWFAARSNGIRFGWARWGFSPDVLNFDDDSIILESPEMLIEINSL